jgi:Protein of unknown function (DUF1236)
MSSQRRLGVIALALIGSVGLATAQTSGTLDKGANLELTPAQRSAIYATVANQKLATPPPANLHVSVGADLPPSMQLYDWPESVAADVPAAKIYKYTVVQDQVVVADPTRMRVVDIIRP